MKQKVVVITGASSGIGAALAKEFSEQGATVVLLARRVERLESMAREWQGLNRRTLYFPCDVTNRQELCEVTERYRREVGPASLVIANAGFGVVGNVESLGVEDYRRQFETNIFGVLNTLYATLDDLKNTKGIFGVVGSVNGYIALPGNSPYAMSKFAVKALATSLRSELSPYGISVTHIAPGFVQSEIRRVDNLGIHHPKAKDVVPTWLQMPAEAAARQIRRALLRRKAEVVITWHGKICVWWVRFFPGFFGAVVRWFRISARPEGSPRK